MIVMIASAPLEVPEGMKAEDAFEVFTDCRIDRCGPCEDGIEFSGWNGSELCGRTFVRLSRDELLQAAAMVERLTCPI